MGGETEPDCKSVFISAHCQIVLVLSETVFFLKLLGVPKVQLFNYMSLHAKLVLTRFQSWYLVPPYLELMRTEFSFDYSSWSLIFNDQIIAVLSYVSETDLWATCHAHCDLNFFIV